MKRAIALTLVLVLAFGLCGCGGQAPAAPETTQAAETAAPETEPTEAEVFADAMFDVEDMVYEVRRGELKKFEVKIRNLTEERFYDLYFRVQALDDRGDVLTAWNMGSSDPLEAGQGYWYYCNSSELFEDCKSIEDAARRAETIRFTYVKIQTVKDDSSSWVQYDFQNPPAYKVADIQSKEGE